MPETKRKLGISSSNYNDGEHTIATAARITSRIGQIGSGGSTLPLFQLF